MASSARASPALSVASSTSTDGGYRVSAEKPSLVISDAEWDKLRKKDLFPSELVKDLNIPSNVYVKALIQMNSDRDLQSMLDVGHLLPVMRKRCILTEHMESKLRRRDNARSDEINTLIFDARGPGRVLTEQLFLCFLDCHERHSYNESNFFLASALKRSALIASGVSSDKQQECKQQYNSIDNAIKTILPDVKIDRKTAAKLSKNLGMCMSKMSSCDLTVVSICEQWQQENPTGRIEHLIQALLSTRGLGRLVSGFCPPTSSNPPIVRRLLSGLKKDWTKLAHHLGYTHEETTSITEFYPDVPKQNEMFLRVFRMPNLGDDTESTLLNAIKLVRPRCSTVGLTDQPTQAQAMSGATYNINHLSIVNNMIFPPLHPSHLSTRPGALPSFYQGQSLSRKSSSSELSPAKLLGFSSESETQTETDTDTMSVATAEGSVSSRCVSPLSMTGYEQKGVDEYSTSNSDQEKQMLQTVTSSDSEGLQEYTTPRYQQGLSELPTSQPLIERSTHDRLSSPSDKEIRGLIKPAATKGDQPTEDKKQKQRKPSKKKQMLHTVTSSDSEGLQEYTTPSERRICGPIEDNKPKQRQLCKNKQPLIERSTHDQLPALSDKNIRGTIPPAPTCNDQSTEDNRQKQRHPSNNKQMLQTVTSSDSEYTTPHYQQGPPEPPTTQPSIEKSTHDQLSSPSGKEIRGLIKSAPTSDDQKTEDNNPQERQLSRNKQMLQTVTRSNLEGVQVYIPHYLTTSKDLQSRQLLNYPWNGSIKLAPTGDDRPPESKKQMMLYNFANLPIVSKSKDAYKDKALGKIKLMEIYSELPNELFDDMLKPLHILLTSNYEDIDAELVATDSVKRSHHTLQLRVVRLQAENRRLREENQHLRQSQSHSVQVVSSRNQPSRILQPGFSKLTFGATPRPVQLRRKGRPSKIPVPLHTCPSPPSLWSTTAPISSGIVKEIRSRDVPSVQVVLGAATSTSKTGGCPRLVPSTSPSPSLLQSGAARGSVRRSGHVQSVEETQEGLYVLCLYSPVEDSKMVVPILAVSISDSHESTERLCQKLTNDYNGHGFALDPRYPVRFRQTTTKIEVISPSPEGYEVIPKQRPTEIRLEEVELRSADDLPAYIIFQIERQCHISVDQHKIRVCLRVNGLDRPYEYEPVIVLTSSLPSAVQPLETWVGLISQHLHHKWYELGKELRLTRKELRNIGTRHSDDIGRCRSVIKKWANNNGSLNDAAVRQILFEAVRNTDESVALLIL